MQIIFILIILAQVHSLYIYQISQRVQQYHYKKYDSVDYSKHQRLSHKNYQTSKLPRILVTQAYQSHTQNPMEQSGYAYTRNQQRQLYKRKYRVTQQITRTEKIRQFQLNSKQQMTSSRGIVKKYAFEVIQVQQFVIKVPIEQNLTLAIDHYVLTKNHYRTISDVTTQTASRIFIEENDKSIYEKSFFFHLGVQITLKKDTKYNLKFYNSGKDTKLFFLQMNYIPQKLFTQAFLDQHNENHLNQIAPMRSQLNTIFDSFGKQWLLNHLVITQFVSLNEYYYRAEIVEIFLTIIISLLQIFIIRKLLTTEKQLI